MHWKLHLSPMSYHSRINHSEENKMDKLSTGSGNSTDDREMDTFSNSALYYEEMDLLPNSTNMAFHSKEMDPDFKSNLNSAFLDKENDPLYKDDMDFIGGDETDPGFHPTLCSSACAVGISGTSSGKPSRVKKHPDQIPKGSTNNTKSSCQGSCPSTGFYPTQSPSPRLPTISETTSMSTCTSTSTATSTVTKLSDAKNSDSITLSRGSSSSTQSDGVDSATAAPARPHTGGDCRWEAVRLANARESPLGLGHFRLLKRLGYGDIGSVYLVELRGTGAYFAMKVMDRASLISRNKLLWAQTEREILSLLDHPFLPTLYSHFETEKFYCLVMEYCTGGNLHSLRQKQPNKYFSEQAARFFASEVLLALEYLHMLGIVYRDLKPENVLVREDGHIMLSDFDLSLRCSVNPTLVKSSSVSGAQAMLDKEHVVQGCMQPSTFFPRILPRRRHSKSKSDFSLSSGALMELLAEPTSARSMSFVGTHEYLAPEIIRGEGHGSAVDWWTFGIFLYELVYGKTPFKGAGNRATLFNVVDQPLRFPELPVISSSARDLIRGLLVKDPQRRIAYRRGATEIKQHPFFAGTNWALVRSTTPPHIPEPVDFEQFAKKEAAHKQKKAQEKESKAQENDTTANPNDTSAHLDFEYF